MLSYLILAVSLSIDSFGIGITYGLRNTKIIFGAKLVVFFISILITSLAIFIGDIITKILPEFMTSLIGTIILVLMGIWIIIQSLHTKEETKNIQKKQKLNNQKVYQFFIKFLGITIQIIRDPISSDLDQSQKIDMKEAIYLGFALSIDSLCVGICSSIIGFSSFLFPLFVATFQLVFLSLGRVMGEKIANISKLPNQTWTVLSGVLLIIIGTTRLLI